MAIDKQSLQNIHDAMDKANADYGGKIDLCIYCHAEDYTSKGGIIHHKDCPIMFLREKIKEV